MPVASALDVDLLSIPSSLGSCIFLYFLDSTPNDRTVEIAFLSFRLPHNTASRRQPRPSQRPIHTHTTQQHEIAIQEHSQRQRLQLLEGFQSAFPDLVPGT